MTDREALEDLLRRFKIEPNPVPGEPGTVRLLSGEGGVRGYSHFFADFEFDADGNFESVSVWE